MNSEYPQPLLLWAKQTTGPQPLLTHFALWTVFHLYRPPLDSHTFITYRLLQIVPVTHLFPRSNILFKGLTNQLQPRSFTPHFITEKQMNYLFLSSFYKCHKVLQILMFCFGTCLVHIRKLTW